MKKITFILFVALNTSVFSQATYKPTSEEFNQYHYLVSSAERMYKHDSALQAYSKFRDAIEGYKGIIHPTHYFDAGMSALKIREEFKALDFFEKAITNGFVVDSNKIKEINFQSQNTKKEFNANYKKWTDARDAKRNFTWEGDLYQAIVDGKKYQGANYKAAQEAYLACLKNKACNKKAPDFIAKYKLLREKQKFDSLQTLKLIADISKYGMFPNLSVLDKESCANARTILLNNDADKTNSQLNDLLFKALNNGDISPSFYAQVIDRRNTSNGLAPEFYEPITGYEKTIANVMPAANAKRKTIGLYNIILPTKDKKPAATATKPAKGAVLPNKTEVDKNIYNY